MGKENYYKGVTFLNFQSGSKGWPTSNIILTCAFNVDTWTSIYGGSPSNATIYASFNAVVQSIATTNNCKFFNLTGVYSGASGDMFDGVHPNDSGHQKIANYIIANF